MFNLKLQLKCLIGKLIELIERYELRHLDLDEDDDSKKIIETIPIDGEVLTDSGYQRVTHLHRTQPYTVYDIEFWDRTHVECADCHVFFRVTRQGVLEEVMARDLHIWDELASDDEQGSRMIKRITRMPYKFSMYDMTVDSPDHRYYTSGILSHNTTTISAFFTWMLVFHADRNILIVANKEDTAKEIVDKILTVFRGLPFFLKPGCENIGKMGLKLDNGSKIVSSATTKTASIGFTIHCMLLDEFAHIPENIVNSFWRSVYPTMSSSKVSQCIITSTPNGTTNKFYEIWSKSLRGENSFKHKRTDYWEVPGHDAAWAEQQRADFGEEEFAQEFELQFNVSSRLLASANDLRYMNRVCRDFVRKTIDSANPFLRDKRLKWHPDFDPNDIKKGDAFIILVDLAEGVGDEGDAKKKGEKKPDFNAFSIWKIVLNSPENMRRYSDISCGLKDAFRFVQVGVYECNDEDEIYTANVCSAVCYDILKADQNENVKVAVEMNFNGKGFTVQFQRHPRYIDGTIQRTYHAKPVPGERSVRRLGFKSGKDKEIFCKKGNKMLNIRRLIPTERETKVQMESFGFIKGKLKGISCKDDLSYAAFAHIPRMLDDETFCEWLGEVMEAMSDSMKKRMVMSLIADAEDLNSEMSDDEFAGLYGNANGYDFDNYDSDFEGYSNMFERNPYSESYGGNFII